MIDESLMPFFNPKGVVIIGASTTPDKLGYGTARNLIHSGYNGNIQLVGQKPGHLLDHPIHASIENATGPLDLAILIVPAQDMVEVIHACGRRGIKGAILISSGFREAGKEGVVLEEACLIAARTYSMRLIGPNCIGIINTHLPIDTTFLQPPMPAAGNISFISQSGAFCAAIIDLMRDQGFGFSHILSLGNQADISETDILPAVSEDIQTRVIVLYLESISEGRKFVQVAREVTRNKPVIALKVGRFEAGRKAAASHTGALVGADNVFEAAFEKSGVLRAGSAEQMFDWARALADCPLPRGKRVAVLTNAGGPGVIAADALELNALELAQLSTTSFNKLSDLLPQAASVHNPVDMLASASPTMYAACLRTLLEDSQVDQVLLILPPPPMYAAEAVADSIIPIIKNSEKPVVVSLMGSLLTEKALAGFEAAHIPTFPFPERAASALGALLRRTAYLQVQEDDQMVVGSVKPRTHTSSVSPSELLMEYGIPVVPLTLAGSADEAVSAAEQVGYPVVLKIASPDIPHKSDASGVHLNIDEADSVRVGYADLLNRVRQVHPDARIKGIDVQKQVPPGQEVILGFKSDPHFGPVMMFGSGGVEVEALKDVTFCLAPLSELEARLMLDKTWAGRRLKGYRNLSPGDEKAVVQALMNLSRLAMENEDIQELEINPLVVHDRGAIALDVRLIHAAQDDKV
jgi:acetyltransferase